MKIFLLLSMLSAGPAFSVTEDELDHCSANADCIVVPYQHCCGSSKRAINKKHKLLYETKKEWQKFDVPEKCALMGACLSDKHVADAECLGRGKIKRCELKR